MELNSFLRHLQEGPVHSIIFSAISHPLALEAEFQPTFEALYEVATFDPAALEAWRALRIEYPECGHGVHIRVWIFLYCFRLAVFDELQ